MGDSLKRLGEFPQAVQSEIGYVLYLAELGESHLSAIPMQGLGVIEIRADARGDTYRSVYTTKFKGHIYVLHCFQKKSKKGIKTPQSDINLIRSRLAEALRHFQASEEK